MIIMNKVLDDGKDNLDVKIQQTILYNLKSNIDWCWDIKKTLILPDNQYGTNISHNPNIYSF